MRRLVSLLVLLSLAACTSPHPAAAPSATVGTSAPTGAGWPPSPNAKVPSDPGQLASALDRLTRDLDVSLRGWTAAVPPITAPPATAVLLAMYQQRVYGTLAAHPALARRVIRLLPGGLARTARANVTAIADLRSLVTPSAHAPRLRTQRPRPAGVLLGYYREAQRRFHVAWQLLAAVNFVESKFGRITSVSSAGAQGPMQFLPATWKAYGLGGNVYRPHDAILGAANYLSASGAPGDDRRAVFAYNPSTAYVNAVTIYAQQMARDPLAYYAYFNWQVYVATRSGDRRLTGPGL